MGDPHLRDSDDDNGNTSDSMAQPRLEDLTPNTFAVGLQPGDVVLLQNPVFNLALLTLIDIVLTTGKIEVHTNDTLKDDISENKEVEEEQSATHTKLTNINGDDFELLLERGHLLLSDLDR